MTPLDAAIIAALLLVAAGGYQQGLIRGLTRAAALGAIALGALVLAIGLDAAGGIQTMVLRTLALCAAIALLVGAITWTLNWVVPRAWHRSRLNRALGVVPAVVQGLLVAALLLGLYHRLALAPETQRYLERGVVTGPLVQPVAWLERALVKGR